jgi:NAD+ kinase
MAAVVLCLHPDRASVVDVADPAAEWLLERGHEVRLSEEDAATADLAALAVGRTVLLDGADLAGEPRRRRHDAAHRRPRGRRGIPVIGVNLGTLGYLTEVEPQHVVDALGPLPRRRPLARDPHAPLRRGRRQRARGPGSRIVPALNEAVVGKTPTGQIVRVRVLIDGEELTTYAADGIIIATPTGSTAYAWSAGGPIVSPDHAALLLTPVAPHMLFDRSLVLPPSSTIRLEIASTALPRCRSTGGTSGCSTRLTRWCARCRPLPATIVTFETRNFLRILKAKFRLDDRSED